MNSDGDRRAWTRRQLLMRTSAFGVTAMVLGSGFIAGSSGAWALEMKHTKPEAMATLIQMARDIYPHDRIPDENYAAAVKGYDDPGKVEMVEAGVNALNAAAVAAGFKSYVDVGWERDRVDILRSMEKSPFFQTVRGGLVTGLYNQKAVWPIFGYEGESFSKGGYVDRGFNDINWI
ncbi:MAG: Twin-arginine translocation pathway signal [Pseudomonadota bacterium]